MEQQTSKRIHRRVVIHPTNRGSQSPVPNSLSTPPNGIPLKQLNSMSSPMIHSPVIEEEEKSLKNIKMEEFPYNLPKNYFKGLIELIQDTISHIIKDITYQNKTINGCFIASEAVTMILEICSKEEKFPLFCSNINRQAIVQLLQVLVELNCIYQIDDALLPFSDSFTFFKIVKEMSLKDTIIKTSEKYLLRSVLRKHETSDIKIIKKDALKASMELLDFANTTKKEYITWIWKMKQSNLKMLEHQMNGPCVKRIQNIFSINAPSNLKYSYNCLNLKKELPVLVRMEINQYKGGTEETLIKDSTHTDKYQAFDSLRKKRISTQEITGHNQNITDLLPTDLEIKDRDFKVESLLGKSEKYFKFSHVDDTYEKLLISPVPMKKGKIFSIAPLKFKFTDEVKETLYCTLFIVDISQGIKVTEDYNFAFQSLTQKIPESLQKELKSFKKEGVFHITTPNTGLYLVCLIERILLAPYSDVITQFSKKSALVRSGTLRVFEKIQEFQRGSKTLTNFNSPTHLSFYRQTVLWGHTKLFVPFDKNPTNDIVLGSLIEGDIEMSLYKFNPNDKRKNFTDAIKKGEEENIIEGNISVKICLLHEDKDVNPLLRLPNNYSSPEKLITLERCSKKQLVNNIDQISNWSASPSPVYQNSIYIYPLSFNYTLKEKKNLNLCVEISLKLGHTVQKSIHSRLTRNLVEYEISSVVYGSKTPIFYDEFKIELPLSIGDLDHLMFTFYHIPTEEEPVKGEDIYINFGNAKREIIGYSFLKLQEGDIILEDKIRSLEVYPTLDEDYLITKPKESKNTFDLQSKVVSSIYSNSSHIETLNYHVRRGDLKQIEKSLREIKNVKDKHLLTHFPGLMNTLLSLLCSNQNQLMESSFLSILDLFNKISDESIFEWYSQYVYENDSSDKIPLFQSIPQLMFKFLNSLSNEYLHLLLSWSWFFFDLITKSLVIHLQKDKIQMLYNQKQFIEQDLGSFFENLNGLSKELMRHGSSEYRTISNRNFTIFLRDLTSIFEISKTEKMIEEYIKELKDDKKNGTTYLIDFFQIYSKHSGFITIKKEILHSYFETIANGIENDRVLSFFLAQLFEFETDQRFEKSKEYLTELYWPFIDLIIEKNIEVQRYIQAKIIMWFFLNINEISLKSWIGKSTPFQCSSIIRILSDSHKILSKTHPIEYTLGMNQILNIFIFSTSKMEGKEDVFQEISNYFLQILLNTSNQNSNSLYNTFKTLKTFIYEGRVELLEQEKFRKSWKIILGGILTNISFPTSQSHPIIMDCLDKLYSAYTGSFDYNVINDESDVVYDKNNNVRGATASKLVHLIFDDKNRENTFEKTFLLTYFSFMSSEELFIRLLDCFHNYYISNEAILVRILNFIIDWIKYNFHTFNHLLISEIIHFMNNDEMLNTKFMIAQRKLKRTLISKLVDASEGLGTLNLDIQPEIPKGFDLENINLPKKYANSFIFLEWSSIEIAKQLTLIEMDLFRRIEPKECFGLAWSKNNKEEMAPNIIGISERFNNVCLWIQSMILEESDVKSRQKLITKWIEICKICRELNNFTTMNQIIAALNSAPIYRLKKTFEGVKEEDKKMIEQYGLLFSTPPYKELRENLAQADGKGTVPFIGVYLTELTFIEDGNPNQITVNNKVLINFSKRKLFADSLRNIQLYQNQIYPFPVLPFLNYVLQVHVFKNMIKKEEMFDKSLLLEPRKN